MVQYLEILATPKNFYIEVTIDLGDDFHVGTKGCIADSLGLKLDGSYQYKYDFLFPRQETFFKNFLPCLASGTSILITKAM